MTIARKALVVHGHRDGNAVGEAPRISAECRARVQTAELAAIRHEIRDVLFSGLGREGCASEARQMAAAWRVRGVRIFLDEDSADSQQNAGAAISWALEVEATELLVVSSWWHFRLLAYYRSRELEAPRVRHARTRRWDQVPAHLLHELRYMPRALRAIGEAATPCPAGAARRY